MFAGNLVGLRLFNHRVHVTYPWLGVVDAGLFFGAFYMAAWLSFMPQSVSLSDHIAVLPYPAGVFAGITMVAMLSMGLYQPRLREGSLGIFMRTVCAFTLMAMGITAITQLLPSLQLWRDVFVYAGGVAFISSLITRVQRHRQAGSIQQAGAGAGSGAQGK